MIGFHRPQVFVFTYSDISVVDLKRSPMRWFLLREQSCADNRRCYATLIYAYVTAVIAKI